MASKDVTFLQKLSQKDRLSNKVLTAGIDMTEKTLTDEEIVQRIVETQNNKDISELYDRFSNKIYRKCLSFVKETNLAEDLTHDVFLKILFSLASFKGKSKFSTWVYSITYNFCIDYIRKRKKERFFTDTYEQNKGIIKEEEIDDISDLQMIKVGRLVEILEDVNVGEKMILMMKYQDGMSIKDIQTAFDLSESAVKMRIKRAKEKVKRIYKERYKEYNAD